MARSYTDFRPRQRPPGSARRLLDPANPHRMLVQARAALAEEFVGITTDGDPLPGLFPIQQSGVSTEPILRAAETWLAALPPELAARARFDVETEEWRTWSNIHPFLMRHGVCLEEMDEMQRDLALALVGATLSADGYACARDIMRLNDFIGELTARPEEYGEWVYWLSIMGTPSPNSPWGWQIDGHHLIVNCFVLGDQMVMTPTFMGSEPVHAETGKYAGIRVFATEEAQGPALMRTLTTEQRQKATVGTELHGETLTPAFHDNVQIPYAGIRYTDLSPAQQGVLLGLVGTYVRRIRPDHAVVKMEEVKRHLSDTYFGWIGGYGDDDVFYYRVQSPVLLIEFDHQRGIALDNDEPSRNHIHTIMRTPNGNDYGKDLLRQHHERYRHVDGVHVPR